MLHADQIDTPNFVTIISQLVFVGDGEFFGDFRAVCVCHKHLRVSAILFNRSFAPFFQNEMLLERVIVGRIFPSRECAKALSGTQVCA